MCRAIGCIAVKTPGMPGVSKVVKFFLHLFCAFYFTASSDRCQGEETQHFCPPPQKKRKILSDGKTQLRKKQIFHGIPLVLCVLLWDGSPAAGKYLYPKGGRYGDTRRWVVPATVRSSVSNEGKPQSALEEPG